MIAAAYLLRIAETNVTTVQEYPTEILFQITVKHVTTIQKTIVYRIVQEHGVEYWSLTSVAYVGGITLRVQTVREYQTEPLGKVTADAYLLRIAETNVTTVQVFQTEILL